MSIWQFFKFNEIFDNQLNFNSTIHDKYIQNSNITLTDGKVYAAGDIHGDYYLFMNILLDLSDLVAIHNDINYHNFLKIKDTHIMEEYLNSILNIPIDIGLKWKHKNRYIVFCGDIVDNKRNNLFNIREKYGKNYIHFPEIKILYIIYYLNYHSNNNAIIKVSGNHDYGNLVLPKEQRDWIDNYAFIFNDELLFKQNRKFYFQYDLNTLTSRLLFHMLFPLVKINEHYFMHGGINIEHFNENINLLEINTNFIKCITNKQPSCKLFNSLDGILWDRTFSSHIFCTDKIPTIPDNYEKIFKDNVIIVGHCPFISSIFDNLCDKNIKANLISIFPIRKNKFKNENEIKKNNVINSYFYNKYQPTCDGKNHGITAQFWDDIKKRPRLLRLDTGMSHAFDKDNIFNIDDDYTFDKYNVEIIGNEYYGRLPQILEINIKKTKYKVKTATVHNALINNKRGMFRNMNDNDIKDKVFEIGFINKNINYKKYIKYKIKYTNLKQQFGGYKI